MHRRCNFTRSDFRHGQALPHSSLRAEACQWLFSITLYLHQSVIILWAFRKQRMLKVCPFERLRTHSPAPSHVYLIYKKGRHGPPFRIGLFDCLQSVSRAGIEVRLVTGKLHSYPASQPAVLLDIYQQSRNISFLSQNNCWKICVVMIFAVILHSLSEQNRGRAKKKRSLKRLR